MSSIFKKRVIFFVSTAIVLAVFTGGFLLLRSVGKETEPTDDSNIKKEGRRYLKVVSPDGGEKFTIGDRIQIDWESKGVNNINIGWVENETNRWIAKDIPTSQGSYTWTASEGVLSDTWDQRVVLKIIIQEAPFESGVSLFDRSDGLITIVKEHQLNY